ncbi:DNA-directed RNA polymerase subunit beta' [Synechococcus sp. R55.2]|uniref:DNA-directed RNA polymerase subunit beta' n=1 Tax=Synechococcus sp. R55.2 TaxID=2964496 RepID=UPI0039C32D1D
MADISRIKALKIGLASPDDIRAWSYGEVKKPETINYRTFKPERDGLFCERIFGPTRDWECSCGRYKRVKNKGIRCERCGVEVTRARVRRERMGHIELAAPVCHLWYLKGQPPSPLGLLLDISPRQLEKVIYFTNYMVIDIDRAGIEQNLGDLQRMVDEAKRNFDDEIERVFLELDARLERELKEGADTLTEQQIAERVRMYESRKESERRERARLLEEMEKAIERLAKLQRYELLDESSWQAIEHLLITGARRLQRDLRPLVRVGQGAEAIRELLREIDLEKLDRELREEISKTQGTRRARAIKRLEIVEAFKNSKTRPEWMILDAVPVLPPELRPMVQLDGGRFATSDLNDLYRRIVNRNNRLRKIMEIRAPKSILNSEKRLLQEAVDALIDNSKRSKPVTGTGGRPLKSLSDMLKGKEGRFRKNLLGKRVDYSGRSVIVVGPTLQLHQCGLPKEMALELFKPFVMQRLIRDQLANNVKNAKNAIDRQLPEVWKALESVIKEHPVLLNRAPTLHRLGIQAFEPVLVEGKAIQLHPLVCHAYNADFDGDQMAVHVPLSFPAQAEARTLMLSTHNLFKPADGSPVVSPLQDIVLGAYYLTMNDPQRQTEIRYRFANPEEARLAFERGDARLHEPVEVRLVRPNAEEPEFVQTTIGRLMFHEIMPDALRYHPDWLNVVYNKKMLSAVIRAVYQTCGHARTVRFLDDLKALGFEWGLRGGITFALTDMAIPAQRDAILQEAAEKARRIDELYDRGELTQDEKRQRKIQLWQRVYDEVSKVMLQELRDDNPLFIITDSGARGSTKQLAQLVGMRGLMMGGFDFRSGGERLVEELPVQHNFQEGLTTLEYFVSGYGARRGLASTALLTANAGYLTRRMCDVAQDVVIREHDCGTPEGIVVSGIEREGDLIEPLFQRIRGRTARRDLRHPITGEPLVAENEIIPEAIAADIDALAQATERFTQTLRELSGKDEGELFTPTDDQPLRDPITGETLLEPYDTLTQETLDRLHARRDAIRDLWLQAGYEWVEHDRVGVPIRSPLTCNTRQGVCAKCYGLDMGTLRPVELGTAVGIIAAESIGEPGTQLTMRVFHTGGVAGAGQQIAGFKVGAGRALTATELEERGAAQEALDLSKDQKMVLLKVAANQLGKPVPVLATEEPSEGEEKLEKRTRDSLRRLAKLQEPPNSGINRVEELFEARKPKGEAITVDYEGEVVDIIRSVGRWVVIKATLPVGDLLVGKMSLQTIEDPKSGAVILEEMEEIRTAHLTRLLEAGVQAVTVLDAVLVPPQGSLEVVKGDTVLAGDRLTPGPLNPHELLRLRGVRGVQEYLIREIQAVYKAQGVDIDDKHLEVIIRQMLRKRRVIDPGDTYFLPGQTVDRFVFEDANRKVIAEGGRPATAEWVLLGVSEAAQQTESFLSAASFQRTVKALTEAAVRGKVDELVGLKENVIIGRLIPAGTGYVKPRFEPKFEWGARAEEAAAVVETREPTLGTLFEEELAADDGGEAQAAVADAPNTEITLHLAESSPDAPALEITLRPAAGEADAPATEAATDGAETQAEADGGSASKPKRERKQRGL